MEWNDVYMAAGAACLGSDIEKTKDAAAEGRYDHDDYEADGYLNIRVAGASQESSADMAVEAANMALERARADIAGFRDDANEFSVLAHGAQGNQGLYYWQPASYIQQRTIRGSALAVEVKQASNSGLVALELALAYIVSRKTPSAALVTTADQYKMPHIDRYEKGLVRGDGATAIILSRGAENAVARIVATNTIGDSTHEGLYTGNPQWEIYPGSNGWPVNMRARAKEYIMGGVEPKEVAGMIQENLKKVVGATLDESGLSSGDISRFVLPNMGLTTLNWDQKKRDLGIDAAQSTWEWGRNIGHMGGGDQVGGLIHLLETHAVHPGEYVALIGVGGGFTFSCVIVQILRDVTWAVSTS